MSTSHTVVLRPYVLSCGGVFGGRNPRTGKPVGSRHSWLGYHRCRFCDRSRDEVLKRADPVTDDLRVGEPK